MKTLRKIIQIPSLVLHELAHIITAYLFGGKLKDIEVKEHSKGHIVCLLNITGLTDKSVKFVAFAPIIVPIAFILIAFISPKVSGICIAYSIINWKTTLPSTTDFKVSGFKAPRFIRNCYN
jgi:hypothetical protein